MTSTAAATGLAPGREEARRWATGELAGREYREQRNWLLDAWAWLNEKLSDLDVPALGTSWSGPVLIAAVLLVLTAVVLLVTGPVRRTAARAEEDAVFADTTLTAQEHRRRAEEAAAAGSFEVAVHERFRALVREAEERTLLTRRPGRTASEASAEIGSWLPALLPGLRAAARTFDDVRYGGRRADAGTYAALAALDEEARTTRPVEPAGTSAAGSAS
ncbi:uncharacterized protein DUF4129 [Kineococcus xinjiangensis]|uniref:Uncharacterized protein DUF4129 n=1 Tax=Kineococcus xinjiangensis TaxID=512762 RepID=A0A2S6IUV1_9ACTN|nr:DUF4129 domain-containing protein [Kineococcus xinjiangensis]PPK97816.1 uncharacterized protein DUF4129 [Kineococcus xinjiangensis]